MASLIDRWETNTYGGTAGEMSVYAGYQDYSIVFRENGHKKVAYHFKYLSQLSDAVIALKQGWLSAARGK